MKITKIAGAILIGTIAIPTFSNCTSEAKKADGTQAKNDTTKVEEVENLRTPVDTAKYNQLVKSLTNGDTTGKWPVKNQPYPLDGAILPFKRIVVYYGNLHSKKIGALGEYAPNELRQKLNAETKNWEKAAQTTTVQIGLHYITAVPSGTAGQDGKYNNKMGNKQNNTV